MEAGLRIPKLLMAQEWIEQTGGAEKVLDEFAKLFPKSDIFCLWNDAPTRYPGRVIESQLAGTALRGKKALALAAMPHAWKAVDLSEYESVLVNSHLFSHHLATRAAAQDLKAFAYVLTPARYIWEPELDMRGKKAIARLAQPFFRRLDRSSSSKSVHYASISNFVRDRVERCWNVESEVIYPPVDTALLQSVASWANSVTGVEQDILAAIPAGFVLGASRFVEYKKIDAAIDVGEALGLPVVLAGSGPDRSRIEARIERATVPVTIVSRPSDELLRALYQAASLFVFMAIEDFGIMPVEAMSLGTPTLVSNRGGAFETADVLQGGIGVSGDSVQNMAEGARVAISIDMEIPQERSKLFSAARFRSEIASWVG